VGSPPPPTTTETPQPEQTTKPEAAPGGTPAPLTDKDLTLPEGFTTSPELMAEFLEVANKNGWSKDQAAQLISLQTKATTLAAEKLSGEFAKTQETWRKEIETAYPGEKLTGAVTNIAKLVDTYGTPELRDAMNTTGAGNNPAVFNFFAKIAEALIVEGKPAGGGTTASQTDPAKLLFPNQN
jgi:hypothetical protein